MRFSYGPIAVKPGQNDVLINPVTIEKPMVDGYITRFRPNLVRVDGTVPPVEQVHLHHGTWLSYPEYGSGPFFASGEEKTVAPFPRGFGMPVQGTDTWLLLYMVHSAVAQPMEAYIIYDIDFIPKAKGDDLGIKPAYPLWLDVRPSGYPVFNTQRSFGGKDGRCTWPKEQCAAFNSWGEEEVGQGQPGNGKGEDWEFPAKGEPFGRAGPVHRRDDPRDGRPHAPGRDPERDRPGPRQEEEPDLHGQGASTGRTQKKGGGPKDSWNFSMPVVGNPFWGVRVKPGDKLRSNVTYDTTPAVDLREHGHRGQPARSRRREREAAGAGRQPVQGQARPVEEVLPQGRAEEGRHPGEAPVLCEQGVVTHGQLVENTNRGGAEGKWEARARGNGNQVSIADFLYVPGDLSTRTSTGIPTVKLGETLRFTNFEGGAIWHTITSCKFPCLGPTGAAFPLADGEDEPEAQARLRLLGGRVRHAGDRAGDATS